MHRQRRRRQQGGAFGQPSPRQQISRKNRGCIDQLLMKQGCMNRSAEGDESRIARHAVSVKRLIEMRVVKTQPVAVQQILRQLEILLLIGQELVDLLAV